MNSAKEKWVDNLLGKMDLDQKVGQLLVFGFCGPVITPDVIELIQKYNVGGLRISQKFRSMTLINDVKPGTEPSENTLESLHLPKDNFRDYAYNSGSVSCTPEEYAGTLNRLRDYALDRKLGIPLHFTIDQEGNGSDDLLSGMRFFPQAMGYAASGDPDLAYRAALCIGKQARALGVNMVHSPVLDVNSNPNNPEIGTRAYSDNGEVARYALESLKGLQETGLVATGKHFPGRGESDTDAHWSLPSVKLDQKTLHREHIAPYRVLIKSGLGAIMIANCCYPALGAKDIPACMSKEIVTDLLRDELGFKGVITTDNMMMGGALEKFTICEAIIRTIEAGCDLVLCRDESPLRLQIIEEILAAVKSGRLSESKIDSSVKRILKMRHDMGLAENGGKVEAQKALKLFNDPFIVKTAVEAAQKSVLLLRDEANVLPLRPEQKVLLIEQIFPTHTAVNNMYSHPGLLWDELCNLSNNVGSVEIPYVPSESDYERVFRRMHEADVIVATNYYYHKMAVTNTDFVRQLKKYGKPMVVITNTPYKFGAPDDIKTVIVSFNPGGRENLRAVAEVAYGKLKSTAKLPISFASRKKGITVKEISSKTIKSRLPLKH